MHSYFPSLIAGVFLVAAGIGWYWYESPTTQLPNNAPTVATSTENATTSTSTPKSPVQQKPVAEDLATMATNALLGTWQSSTDTQVVREFKTGGVFVDTRGGTTIGRGTWRTFVGEKAPAVSFEAKTGHVYMTIIESGETKYAKVNNLTLDQLHLVYMDRPGMFFYSRIE
jgi:hypothetical protein